MFGFVVIGVLLVAALARGGGTSTKKKTCWRAGMPDDWREPLDAMMADEDFDPQVMYQVADVLEDQGFADAAECVRSRADWLQT